MLCHTHLGIKFWWEGSFDIFDGFQSGSQNLTNQKFASITVFTGAWWKTVTIHQNIFHQIFKESVIFKIPPSKFCAIRYMVPGTVITSGYWNNTSLYVYFICLYTHVLLELWNTVRMFLLCCKASKYRQYRNMYACRHLYFFHSNSIK